MKSLCEYCRFQMKCSLTTNKSTIYDCSEYDRDLIFSDISRSKMNEQSNSSIETVNGSFIENENQENISLKQYRQVVISCE